MKKIKLMISYTKTTFLVIKLRINYNYVIKLFKTKSRLQYLKNQFVPRSKHVSSRL